jgi:Fe-S-cluster-containing dehydrogenase component/DMSO reductase anchor subunit
MSSLSSLPLLARAAEDGAIFALTRARPSGVEGLPSRLERPMPPVDRMPGRAPGPGEQYRFHFDMRKCIACKCCVVACNEQNGNPPAINWRRVGEIEGGWYPNASRAYLSMGCNHCLDPTCLEGCPVDAYSKDPATGIVRHSADACIGCQYCTWNCSYGVPQFNPERGVVGKCDMCHGRLSLGQAPACVSACPQGAIQIEIVNVTDWRAACEAVAPPAGVPVADHSLSATRVTPLELPPDARPVASRHVAPEHPHWPLVIMTVLTQLSVGAFATIWVLQLLGASTRLAIAAIVSVLVGGLALAASTLHLGRPIHAYRALKMWRRSWLSREVLAFTAFSASAAAYAAMLWLALPGAAAIGGLTTVLGLAGVMASGCIYRVPSRPVWNSPSTPGQFTLTAGILGPLFAAAVGAGDQRSLALTAATMAGAQFALLALLFFRCIDADSLELRGTARLLSTVLARRMLLRSALLGLGAVVLPLWGPGAALGGLALVLAAAAEILGRHLFFVSVVPKHLAAPYVASASEAA